MRKILVMIAFTVLLLQQTVGPAVAITDEEREIVVEYAHNTREFAEFGSKALNQVLDNDNFKEFFEGFAGTIKVIEVADKVANADDRAALRIIGQELGKRLLKQLAPDLANAVGWLTWAQKGMSLFKEFVFNPWIEGQQVQMYIARRSEGADPEEAAATALGYGYARERAMKELESQGYQIRYMWEHGHRDLVNSRIDYFLAAAYEAEYQKYLLQQAARLARQNLGAYDQELYQKLREASENSQTTSSSCGGSNNPYEVNLWDFGNGAPCPDADPNTEPSGPSNSESGVFFENPAVDGYALDVCRVWEQECGQPAADAFCQAQGYEKAINYQSERYSPTKVIGDGRVCTFENHYGTCGRISSVTCAGGQP